MQVIKAAAEKKQNPNQISSAKHSLLLVDDEVRVLKALKRVFVDENYKILTAENGRAALDILTTNVVNLVISDYSMPGMTGVELLTTIREKYPNTIRIMLTAHSNSDVVMAAVNDGAVYKFINKPWNDDDLQLTVKLALVQYDLIKENKKLKEVNRQQLTEISRFKHFTSIDHSPLGSFLIDKGILLPGQLEMVEKYRKQNKTILIKSLIGLGMVDEKTLFKIIQELSKADLAVFSELQLNRNLSQLLPREICETGCLIPVLQENKNIYIVMADPLDLERIGYIKFALQSNVIPKLGHLSEIEKAIKYIYDGSESETDIITEMSEEIEDDNKIDIILDEEEVTTAEQLMVKSSTPPAIKVVNTIIGAEIRAEASDIHIEPKPNYTIVRFRIDGLLHNRIKLPSTMHLSIISRLKILAKMDIAERRIPQDGRITIRSNEKFVDTRVSSMPTINGEKMVLRLLEKNAAIKSLTETGIRDKSYDRLNNITSVPQGLIIATGPTGSGKTTTLYSMMKKKLSNSQNFVTIEDPVEYLLEKASQIHIHAKIGLTFASSLRSTLRQDPDVILVGEIRDLETAKAAFQAAMTGHLVFTSLHTNSTIATISRLLHLGVEPFLIASAVQGIIAQRLVRKICPHCKESKNYDQSLLDILGAENLNFPEKLYYGKGCDYCNNTGFLGRAGLFEVFQMNEEFRHFLTADYRESKLLNMAKSLGMETLLEDGLKKVLDGWTTLEELLRVLGPTIKYEYYCTNCGKNLDVNYITCPYCGTAQKKICGNCQSQLESDWVTCPYCGQSS